ncbi:MAG: hypothetical protein IKD18_03845 [Clostridia bacterium]|nr:hypothetical protein [Clostridia bacterium]
MSKIKFGWSEKNLLPQGAVVSLAGQFYERVSGEVESELTVTCLAMDSGNDAAIFCSCDLVSVSSALLGSVRTRLKDHPEIPGEKVMISAIHTHTAPSYAGRSDAVSGLSTKEALRELAPDVKYVELVPSDQVTFDGEEAHRYLAERIAESVIEAWESRKEGGFVPAFGRAAVGLCRRACYDDGSAKMWGDTGIANFEELESGNDSGIELLFTYDKAKKLTGVVANVACPAQVLEHRSFISSDYWGKVKENLRKEYGSDLFLLALCSPAGDQCPRDLIRWVEPETPVNDPNIRHEIFRERGADPSMFDLSGCRRVARRISTEILFALEEAGEPIWEAPLSHRVQNLPLPLRRVTVAQRDNAIAAIREYVKGKTTINYEDSALLHVHVGTVARYRAQQEMDTHDVEIHAVRLGSLAFCTNPFELFLNYGNKIRARSRATQTFLIQLSCGNFGYLPTRRAEEGSHYSAYVSSGNFGHVGGDLLVRHTLEEIRKLFPEV